MKRMLFRMLAVFLSIVILVSCGQSSIESYRDDLKNFNNSTVKIVDNFETISQKNGELSGLLAVDDLEGYGSNIKTINSLLNETVKELDKLQKSSDGIESQNDSVQVASLKLEPVTVTVVGTTLVIAGLVAFGKKCKDLAKKASDQWKKTSDTLADVADDKATVEEFKAEKDKLIETQQEFGNELGSRMITGNIPGNPSGLGTLILKEVVTDQAQKGVKTIFATKKCQEDVESSSCKVGAATTDDNGKVPVFPEKTDVVTVKEDKARVVVEDVEVPAGSEEEVARAEIPVEDATPEKVTQNDDGTYDPTQVDDDDDGGNGNTTIMCYDFVDGMGHYACLKYNGSEAELQNEDYSDATFQCIDADYRQYREYFESDSDCREECRAKAVDGRSVCDTP